MIYNAGNVEICMVECSRGNPLDWTEIYKAKLTFVTNKKIKIAKVTKLSSKLSQIEI